MIVLRVSPWFDDNLQMIMNPHRTARHRYEIVIGEKGLAVNAANLRTGQLHETTLEV